MEDFNVAEETAKLKAQTKAIRKKGYRKSRLDKYKGELLLLKHDNNTPAELQRWLRARRIKVELSTVTRWLDKNGKV